MINRKNFINTRKFHCGHNWSHLVIAIIGKIGENEYELSICSISKYAEML